MISKKVIMPIVAFAMVVFFGCESSTTSATNVVAQNNVPSQDSTVIKDSTAKNNAVPGRDTSSVFFGDTATNQGPVNQGSSVAGVVSCDVTTIGNGHTCIEAEAVFADSVKAMCNTEEAFVTAASYREEGCPAGASKTCFEKDEGDSATVYFYGTIFANMSCEELLGDDDDDDVEIMNPSTGEPMKPVVLTGDKFGCSYYGVFCAEGDASYAENCVSEGGTVVNACPAGGEKCDLGQLAEEGVSVYVYPDAGLSCETLTLESQLDM